MAEPEDALLLSAEEAEQIWWEDPSLQSRSLESWRLVLALPGSGGLHRTVSAGFSLRASAGLTTTSRS